MKVALALLLALATLASGAVAQPTQPVNLASPRLTRAAPGTCTAPPWPSSCERHCRPAPTLFAIRPLVGRSCSRKHEPV